MIQEYLTIPHNGKPDSQAVYASIACEYIINALKKLNYGAKQRCSFHLSFTF